jgi:hypothetical protein
MAETGNKINLDKFPGKCTNATWKIRTEIKFQIVRYVTVIDGIFAGLHATNRRRHLVEMTAPSVLSRGAAISVPGGLRR